MPKSKQIAISRRKFALGAAAAATAALLPGSQAQAESPVPSQSQSDAAAKLSPGARAELEAKLKELFRKYGNRLSDAQKADIRKAMAETQDGLEKMRSFALANGDQPATVFTLNGVAGRTSAENANVRVNHGLDTKPGVTDTKRAK